MTLDNHGNVTSGLTLHDVLRWLVRGGMPNTEHNQHEALLAIDAHENGFDNSDEWRQELDHRAKVAAEQGLILGQAVPGPSLEDRNAALEAKVQALATQLEALTRVQAGPTTQRPATPSG